MKPLLRTMALLVGLMLSALPGHVRAQASVDLALVLAVDASTSVSRDEFGLQLDGIATSLRHPRVIQTIRNGAAGAIAIALVEWSSPHQTWLAIPWTRVSDAASANRLADMVSNTPRLFNDGGTAIGAALKFSADQFDLLPFPTARKVIDVSGDGSNTHLPDVSEMRDAAIARGITINGLPILSREDGMEKYYRNRVIGGPGSFLEIAVDYDSFPAAMLRKLLREIRSDPLVSILQQR
ncbi:MAG: DUF1194 domain-containing protein [Minwuia sp.]|nr:DUF1194 domain-containing protein [Minwuia sp.]